MKLNFDLQGRNVRLEITTDIPYYDTWVLYFYWDATDPIHGGLLTQHLAEDFRETIQLLRQEAYEQGWYDAKAKRAKRTWFSGWL